MNVIKWISTTDIVDNNVTYSYPFSFTEESFVQNKSVQFNVYEDF